jgi:TPR repeat protein
MQVEPAACVEGHEERDRDGIALRAGRRGATACKSRRGKRGAHGGGALRVQLTTDQNEACALSIGLRRYHPHRAHLTGSQKLRRFSVWRIAAFALVAIAVSAHADYDRAVAAVKRGDAAAAFKEFRAAAEAGDERAFVQVARAYAHGIGTPPDPRAAALWAQKSAAKGDAEGVPRLCADGRAA